MIKRKLITAGFVIAMAAMVMSGCKSGGTVERDNGGSGRRDGGKPRRAGLPLVKQNRRRS